MAGLPLRNDNAMILLVGALLGLYLVTLVGFAYLSQQRLRQSLIEQERLNAEKQAVTLAHFVTHQQALVNELATSRRIQNHLANRQLGLAKHQGTDNSLRALSDEFERMLTRPRLLGGPGYQSIALAEPDGHVLLRVNGKDDMGGRASYAIYDPTAYGTIQVRREPSGNLLVFSAPVRFNGRTDAILLAEMNARDLLNRFLAEHGKTANYRRTGLIGPDDRVVVANGPFDWHDWREHAETDEHTIIEIPLVGTGMHIVKLPDAAINRAFLASPLLIAALALTVLPLLAGVVYLWRLNNHNLVLNTRFQTTSEQRALLRAQNRRLQHEIDKRIESEQKLAHHANFDQLTGLPNRTLALDRLAQALKWAKREDGGVLVMFLDLDRFKQINDSLGHTAGDELLREAAQRIQSNVRESDTVSRLGGDEFMVICPELPRSIEWESCARDLLETLSTPFYVRGHEFFVGASIGVCAYPEGGSEPNQLLKNADIAMYAAKGRGRNRYCLYEPSMDAIALEGLKLEHNLRHALERNEFSLLFQPIVDLTSSRVVAVEALLRWQNAELGQVSPERFIPVAEETGLIHDIGDWVLHEACHVLSTLPVDTRFRIAVNISSKQFSRPKQLLDNVLDALRHSGLMPSQLELEITESILVDDRPETADLIHQLDRLGVRLSIDDFGTGYSALNYLQRFPFDMLKIDRSFTNQVPGSRANASLIRAIIAMAHAFDLEVVAEGIESREQVAFLLVNHCELGQGYLYSEPMTPAQLYSMISDDALSA